MYATLNLLGSFSLDNWLLLELLFCSPPISEVTQFLYNFFLHGSIFRLRSRKDNKFKVKENITCPHKRVLKEVRYIVNNKVDCRT